MKKLFLLMILMAGFVVCQANAAEKHPPGLNQTTLTVEKVILQDNHQFDVVEYGCILINVDRPVAEFSNYLTYELSSNYSMPDKQQSTFERWFALSAGGVAYRYSNGQGKLLNINLDPQKLYVSTVDKTLAPETNEQVWLKNCNNKRSNIGG